MQKRVFFKKGLLLAFVVVVAVSFSSPVLAQSTARQALHNSRPQIVSNLTPTGRVAGASRMNLAVSLPVRNEAALDQLIGQLSDPASPNYRHYLTPEQFREQFGPSEADYQATEIFFRKNGFIVTGEHASRMVLDISGTAANVERVLHVTMRTYQHPFEERSFFAPDAEPSLDLGVPILQISGLDNYSLRVPRMARLAHLGQSANASTNAPGSGPGGTFMGKDFRNAYLPGVSLTGTGQSLGLLEFDAYFTNDIKAYSATTGVTMVQQTVVAVDGGVSSPGDGNGEVALDIDMAMSIAPGLISIGVFEAPNGSSWVDILDAMANNAAYRTLSCSWGDSSPGAPNTGAETVLKQMITEGQSFFNASGDSDAFTNGIPFPSESTNATQVGGTTLTTTGPGGAWVLETTWNWGDIAKTNSSVGSCGGISKNFKIPSWQKGIDMTANMGSTTNRNVPDVAMTADNVFLIADDGTNYFVGGTSCAAPLWAAFTALANQQAIAKSKSYVGFINPTIYTAGEGANYLSVFNDIVTGNNFWMGSTNLFSAVPGYDLCTGWGTPVGDNMIDLLSGASDALGVAPGRGFVAVGPQSGPFSSSTLNFSLTNSSASSINWSLSNTSLWFTASASGGTLSSHTATNVVLSLSSAAYNLTNGIYTTNMVFKNLNNGAIRTRPFTLLVGQSLVQNGGFEYAPLWLSYWSQTGTKSTYGWDFVDTTNKGESITGIKPHSGRYLAVLGPPGTNGYISQTISTVPGQSYLLSFWTIDPTNKTGKTQQFSTSWNTNTLFTLLNPPKFSNWSNYVFFVTATATNSLLQFAARGDSSRFGLDDVSLFPFPAPNIQTFKTISTNFLFSWNTMSGIVYHLQYTTNLLSTNWINLTTNTAKGTTVSVTNQIGTDPSRFYRIGSP